MKIFNKENKERSFTLAEMLVVITMIIILVTIIIVGTEGTRALSRDKRRIADLAAYQVALQEYYSYYKSYPFNNCSSSNDNWSMAGCGAPQTQQECNSIEGCSSDDGKFCTCVGADEFLEKLKTPNTGSAFLDPLPKDPRNDNNFKYLYSFPLPNRGKSYKISVPLERDTQAMENDGGTDLALYEVFSTLGASIAVDTSFFEGISGELTCAVRNVGAGTCPETEKMVLRLSGQYNAHAGLVSSSNYPWAVCCSPSNLTVGSGTAFLKLSVANNAHVEKITGSSYTQNASFSSTFGTVQCDYFSACPTGTTCLASISADTNAHIASCEGASAYTTKVCCLIQ